MDKRVLLAIVIVVAFFIVSFLVIPQERQLQSALSVSELLKDPMYDTEVRVYGRVSLLGELFCPCFELASGGEKVLAWYDLMIEDNGTERPPANMEMVDNGDWVIVTGELKSAGQQRSLNDFWVSNIEKIEEF